MEAPAKVDHGDIDILVTEPVDPKAGRNPEYLASLVGAKRWKRMKGSDTIHLAVPWPTSTESETTPERSPASSAKISSISTSKLDSTTGLPPWPKGTANDPDNYIQLDICVLPSLTTLSWLLFLHAHGDFWSILGSLLRRYGLTVTPSGFYVHIPEIEGQNKSLSRVKVTDDPGLALRYLSLEEERYWRGFGSWDEMLGYVCECRFVDLGRGKRKEEYERREREEKAMEGVLEEQGDTVAVDGEGAAAVIASSEATLPTATNHLSAGLQNGDAPDGSAAPPTPPATNNSIENKPFTQIENGGPALKSNDRQRAGKRPLFAYFLTTYIDTHATIDTPPGSAAKLAKQEVVEDAKAFFGNEFAERYEKARRKGIEAVGVQGLWSNVRNMIKADGGQGDELGYGMKGVKGCVCGDEFGFLDIEPCDRGGKEESEGVAYEGIRCAREAFREMRYDEVLEWAKQNWRKVGMRQKRMDMEISGKKLAAKIEAERVMAMGQDGRSSP